MAKSVSNIEQLMVDESFQRWISNSASAEENKHWSDWLQSDFRHQDIYQEAIQLWKLAQFRPASLPDINLEWKHFQHSLNYKATKRASAIDLSAKRTFPYWHFSIRESWFRYAAIAAALLLIFLFWYNLPRIMHSNKQAFQTVSTEYGQRVRITLPKSTTIILNANSTLRYPTVWTDKTVRHFELQGEAYFIVSSLPEGNQHPFIVSTRDGKLQVVGTRFVVYDRGRGTRVAVEEGCVEVFVSADTFKQAAVPVTSALINSGHLLEFQEGDKLLKPKSKNVEVYTSWWSDQMVFDNTPFEDIVRRLEETYGVQIEVTVQQLLKRSLSGSIENSNLQIITMALAKALQIAVHREGNIITFGQI